MLLLYPPVAKICEPPAGIAYLAAGLRAHNIDCEILDLNLSCMRAIFNSTVSAQDTWTKRALKNKDAHLKSLTGTAAYSNIDKYKRAVHDLSRLLHKSTTSDYTIHFANFTSKTYSPTASSDLIKAFSNFEDNPFFPHFSKELDKTLGSGRHSEVGISLNFLNQAVSAFAIGGYIRKHFPQIKLFLGGGLVTTWVHLDNWNNPFSTCFHEIIPGPGLPKLLELYGIHTKSFIPCPDYSDLYQQPYLSPGFILPYTTSTGCFWRKCAFCPEKTEKSVYTPVAPELVQQNIQELISTYNPAMIHFLDNAISPRVLNKISEIEYPAPWYGFVRLSKHLKDLAFCKRLKRSGCAMLKLGIESGSDKVLKKMNKGTSVRLASEVLHTLHKAGIATYVYLLFGTPAETQKEAEETLSFTAAHTSQINFLNLAVFNMVLASPDAAAYEARPFSKGDLSLYGDFIHPLGWDRKKIRAFLDTSFKSHPAVRPILQSDPPYFTSNHAPFCINPSKNETL